MAVLSTVPVPCQALSQQCGLPLVLSVHEPGGSDATLLPALASSDRPPSGGLHVVLTSADHLGHQASNLALSACQVQLRPSRCSAGGCGRAVFSATAVTDFARDGNRPSVISVSPSHGAPRLWRNYVPDSVKVS